MALVEPLRHRIVATHIQADHDEDQSVGARDGDVGEVAHRHRDLVTPRLGAQLGDVSRPASPTQLIS